MYALLILALGSSFVAQPASKGVPPEVAGILDELRLLPPAREPRPGEQDVLRADNLPAFPARALDELRAKGYKSVAELRERYKKNPKMFVKSFPLRAAFFDTVKALEQSNKGSLPATLNGPLNPKQKTSLLGLQQDLGTRVFELEQALDSLRSAAPERDKEPLKRWRAHFDYATARLESRLLYLMEYDYLLAGARGDRLPQLKQGQPGWRVTGSAKLQITETKAKQLAKEVSKRWKRIEDDYPDTPWAALARRESQLPLGLEWAVRKK